MPPATLMEELGAEMRVGSQVFQDHLLSMHMTFFMLIYSFSINLGCSLRDLAFHFNPASMSLSSSVTPSAPIPGRQNIVATSFFRGCTVKVRSLCQHGVMGYVGNVW